MTTIYVDSMTKTEYNPRNALAVKSISSCASVLIDVINEVDCHGDDIIRYTIMGCGNVSHHKAKIRYGARKTTFRTPLGTMDLNDFMRI